MQEDKKNLESCFFRAVSLLKHPTIILFSFPLQIPFSIQGSKTVNDIKMVYVK